MERMDYLSDFSFGGLGFFFALESRWSWICCGLGAGVEALN